MARHEITDKEWQVIGELRAGTARVVPNPPGSARCGHKEYADGHCAEMICSNYYTRHVRYGQED